MTLYLQVEIWIHHGGHECRGFPVFSMSVREHWAISRPQPPQRPWMFKPLTPFLNLSSLHCLSFSIGLCFDWALSMDILTPVHYSIWKAFLSWRLQCHCLQCMQHCSYLLTGHLIHVWATFWSLDFTFASLSMVKRGPNKLGHVHGLVSSSNKSYKELRKHATWGDCLFLFEIPNPGQVKVSRSSADEKYAWSTLHMWIWYGLAELDFLIGTNKYS